MGAQDFTAACSQRTKFEPADLRNAEFAGMAFRFARTGALKDLSEEAATSGIDVIPAADSGQGEVCLS